MGLAPDVPEATKQAKEDVARALTVLNAHLQQNTYMVGHRVTLADITVACALVDGFKYAFEGRFMKPYGNVERWFDTLMLQPEFKSVLGDVSKGGGASKPAASPKAKAEKAEKAEAKKGG